MKYKITILDGKTFGDDVSLDILNNLGYVDIYHTTNYEDILENIGDSNIVITNKVVIDKYIIDNSNIKLICVAATGMNNIDLQYAKEKNIIVKNVVQYSTSSVAQLTFSIVFQFIQQISYYNKYVLSGSWSKSDIFTNLDKSFDELDGKTWGIIGLGNIGLKVATIATSFGCNIQYYSTSGKNNNSKYTNVSLEQLLKSSDIISIHCSLNDDTKNLLDKNNLNLLKDKTILLNLGRGGVVNENDIAKILDKKDIYFGTDVITKEPINNDNPLLAVQNKNRIIITPHIGWASKQARIRLIDGIVDNIKKFIDV